MLSDLQITNTYTFNKKKVDNCFNLSNINFIIHCIRFNEKNDRDCYAYATSLIKPHDTDCVRVNFLRNGLGLYGVLFETTLNTI